MQVDYTGFTTINPQRFGQKFVGKVANPHDILLFTKAAKKRASTDGPIDEKEKLRPEELNQQNIEALVAESNLVRHSLQCTFVETETLLRNMFFISHAGYYWNRWFYTQ
jgi:hypothetical protein